MRNLQNAAPRQQPRWTTRAIIWRHATALPRLAAGSVLRRPQVSVCASLACTPMSPALSEGRRQRQGRQLAVRPVAMVNVDFASPSLLLGTMLIGCGVLLLNLRNFQNKVSRDADIVVAAMVSIVGSTLIFQGWRLDPLLLLCQALTTSVAFWYGLETFRLRSKEADLPAQLPPGADVSSLDAVQQQMPQQQYYQGGTGFPSAGAQGVPYLPPGSESYYPWGTPADSAASTSGRVGAAAGPYETIQYDYYGNPIMPQQEPTYESAGRYTPYPTGAVYGARPNAFGSGDGGGNPGTGSPAPPPDIGYDYGSPPLAPGTSYPGPSAPPPDTYGDGGDPGTGSPAPPADIGYDYGSPPLAPGTSYPGPSAPPPDSYGLPPVSTPPPPPLPDGTLAPGQFDFAAQPPTPLGASASGRGGSSSAASTPGYYSPGAAVAAPAGAPGTTGPVFDGFGAGGFSSEAGFGAGGWGPGVAAAGAAAAAAAGRGATASSGGRMDLFEKVDDWE